MGHRHAGRRRGRRRCPPAAGRGDGGGPLAHRRSEGHPRRTHPLRPSPGRSTAWPQVHEKALRAGSYASLDFAVDTSDPARGALMQEVSERSAALSARAGVVRPRGRRHRRRPTPTSCSPTPKLADHRHHLQTVRAGKPHVLSEVEERLLATTAPTGRQAWVRLFTEQTSAIQVTLPDEAEPVSLDAGLSRLLDPDRSVRQAASQAVTEALQPGPADPGLRVQHPPRRPAHPGRAARLPRPGSARGT